MSKASPEIIPDIDGDFPPRLCLQVQGQEAIEQLFLQNLGQNKLHHAWLLTGPRGIGKASMAYKIAKFMLHHQNPITAAQTATSLDVPAGSQAVHLVNAMAHPDFMVLSRPYDLKKDSFKNDIPVAATRRIGNFMSLTSGLASWRICIIDSIDEMTISAANAVLKILEEPPASTLFLLVSHNPGRLLDTIRSRCQTAPLDILSPETVQQLLSNMQPDLEANEAAAIAFLAEGSIGYALEIASLNGLAVYREMVDMLVAMPQPDGVKLHALAERMNSRSADGIFSLFTQFLSAWLHRMVRGSAKGLNCPVLFQEEGESMARLMGDSSLEQWVEVWEKVSILTRETELLNLDRKQTVLESFSLIRAAATQK